MISNKLKKEKTNLYARWHDMLRRCYNQEHPKYKNYGGRGITVCNDWKSDFENFFVWSLINGYDRVLTLDRIDVNDNYSPSNCRWTTQRTQQSNKTNTVYTFYKGYKISVSTLSEITGIERKTLMYRIQKGISGEQLLQPIRESKEK